MKPDIKAIKERFDDLTQRWTENGMDFIDTKNEYESEVSEAYCEDIPALLAYIADLEAVAGFAEKYLDDDCAYYEHELTKALSKLDGDKNA